jgi:low affinity Fe/Cu permease
MKPHPSPVAEKPAAARWLAGFQKFARQTARSSGHPLAFALALGLVVFWAVTGPLFNSGNTWLLIINTITNIVTFLMIFLIRNAQNRESEAVQLKLDELIRATTAAQNSLLDIEELSEEELDRIKARFERLARKARETSEAGQTHFLQHQEDRRPVPVSTPSTPPLP